MHEANDKFLDKLGKKDYNNRLETVLEKKYFDEDVKSILLSILYKIEASYKDYRIVKQDVDTKEKIIEKIIDTIKNECDEIKLLKPNSEESKIIGNRTFLVEKNKKRIICQNIERKLLYCIAKISKKEKIVNDNYFIINETLSNLINTGNNINMVEPLRDFNGYSWTTISKEIESVEHNLIYQNLIFLTGNEFIDKWIYNKEIIIDYLELFKDKMQKLYGEENTENFIKTLEKISILLEVKFDSSSKSKYKKMKTEVEEKLEEVEDNTKYIENITRKKKKLAKEIRKLDETMNNKKMLQQEYIDRNELLPLEKKIFSIRILKTILNEERSKKIEQLEKLNEVLRPQNFVKYKRELEEKKKILNILETNNIQKGIDELKLNLQKTFLKCFEIKIDKVQNKQELIKLIYEYRYYLNLFYNYENRVYDEKSLNQEVEYLLKKILYKAHKYKVIQRFSNKEEVDYELLKNIFKSRSIKLEELEIKLTKEKNEFFVHIFDGKSLEERYEMKKIENIRNKDFEIRYNKKVKAFY